MYGVGWVLQRGMLERSIRAGVLIPLLTTFGLGIVIENLLLQVSSPDVRSLGGQAGRVVTTSWRVSNQLSISALGVLILAVAVAVLGGLHLFLRARLPADPCGRSPRTRTRRSSWV